MDERLEALLRHPFVRILLAGATGFPVGDAARTDAPGDGAIHFYRSGSTIVMQMYDATGGAWRSTTLS